MSDSQRFPVAVHALVYMAHKGALSPQRAVASSTLAQSVPTNPVVVRRVTSLLAKARLIETRSGATGGAWLAKKPSAITLADVLKAVHGCAHLGAPTAGAQDCPVGQRIPKAIAGALKAADDAACDRLSRITVADLLAEVEAAAA